MNCGEIDARVLIIGYGNPLRGDDGLGWHAAEALRKVLDDPSIRIDTCHQLVPELAEPVGRADLVIFIDACCDRPPGELGCRPVQATGTAQSMFHHLDAGALLALAAYIGGKTPRAYVITVGAESFDYTEQLSATVAAVVPRVVETVRRLIHA